MNGNEPYNVFSDWLVARYGCRVRKISLATPLGCPNRDGTIGTEGCAFCDENMAGPTKEQVAGRSVAEQLSDQVALMEKRAERPQKYMAYLQSGTNTHGAPQLLREEYKQAILNEKVVSVAIGTRPDCIDEDVLDLVEEIFGGLDTWIELGVQSANDRSLQRVGRNHTFAHTARAINLIKHRGLLVCAHLILGLPGETKEDAIETIRAMNAFGVDGVKFHPLSICKGAKLEEQWRKEPFNLLGEDEYTELVIELLERLSPEIVVQRLVGGGRPEVHIAPEWAMNPSRVIQKINSLMLERRTRQGARKTIH